MRAERRRLGGGGVRAADSFPAREALGAFSSQLKCYGERWEVVQGSSLSSLSSRLLKEQTAAAYLRHNSTYPPTYLTLPTTSYLPTAQLSSPAQLRACYYLPDLTSTCLT